MHADIIRVRVGKLVQRITSLRENKRISVSFVTNLCITSRPFVPKNMGGEVVHAT